MTDYKALYEQAIAETVPKNQYNAVSAHLLGENNLLKKKLAEAEEFKKNAEETCEGYAVTDSLMKQIEQKDLDIKNIYEHHEKQLKVALDLQKLLKEEKEELEEQMEQMYDEEDVKYWKNFALVYWSGNQLGTGEPGGGEVWTDALEKVNDADRTGGLEAEELDELTEKCMAD